MKFDAKYCITKLNKKIILFSDGINFTSHILLQIL